MTHGSRSTNLIAAVCACVILMSYGVLFLDLETIMDLASEDGLFEYATAIFFICTSIAFLYLFATTKPGFQFLGFKTGRSPFYLLLALVFLMGCGEEISWGQRIFGFETTEAMREHNIQGEMNIHNLALFNRLNREGEARGFWSAFLNMGRMYSIFWATYCVLIPVSCVASSSVRRFCRDLSLPVVPLALGLLFVPNYLIQKTFEWTQAEELLWPQTEIKESNTALLFLAFAVTVLLATRASASSALEHEGSDSAPGAHA